MKKDNHLILLQKIAHSETSAYKKFEKDLGKHFPIAFKLLDDYRKKKTSNRVAEYFDIFLNVYKLIAEMTDDDVLSTGDDHDILVEEPEEDIE